MRESLRRRVGAAIAVTTLAMLALPAVALAGVAGQGVAGQGVAGRGVAGLAGSGARLAGPFVSLGDSYAAGNLVPSSPVGSPAGCLRSSHNYGADAAAALGLRYVDVACTGARTANMTSPEPVLLGTNPPQFRALAADDSVVTLTLGGDDIGFLSILKTCAALSLSNLFGHPCQRHYTAGGADRLVAAVNAAAPKIAAVLRGIRTRAPRARVLLVGYPDILPVHGHGCWPVVPFAFGDVPYLRGIEADANHMLARAAAANGARYVDTYQATTGHDACQDESNRDVEGLIPASLAYPFHPNRRGQLVMAQRVLAALRR